MSDAAPIQLRRLSNTSDRPPSWAVDGTYLVLTSPGGWRFWPVPVAGIASAESVRWLHINGLQDATFDSRAEALRCLSAVIASASAPLPSPPVGRLVPRPDGSYVSVCRRFRIERASGRLPDGRRRLWKWRIDDTCRPMPERGARTLTEAAQFVAARVIAEPA
jgi:hypothetical protein